MSNNSPSRKIDSSIIAALIGVAGTVIVTLITLYANRPQAVATPTSSYYATPILSTEMMTNTATVAPTDTAAPGEPTSTPAPPTNTPVPTMTPIPPVAIGEDWSAGCISTLWRPYPSNVPTIERGDGCWQEPIHVFSAENGDLDFISARGDGGTDTYGLFAPLPESGSVSFYVKLEQLDNVDLLMGIYAEPDVVNAQGLLMIIPHERLNKLRIVQKDNVISYNTLQGTGTLDQGNGFWITFTFTPNSASSTVNPSVFVTNPVSIASSQKWLFLGYRGLPGSYRLEGRFFRLELK
jgi:hypothetical protein